MAIDISSQLEEIEGAAYGLDFRAAVVRALEELVSQINETESEPETTGGNE
ncbi:MAG: hypothetical protein IJ740_13385 [Ruminococcus sp.]|nr:hypothetical protein [Ruminococcus sp.]